MSVNHLIYLGKYKKTYAITSLKFTRSTASHSSSLPIKNQKWPIKITKKGRNLDLVTCTCFCYSQSPYKWIWLALKKKHKKINRFIFGNKNCKLAEGLSIAKYNNNNNPVACCIESEIALARCTNRWKC